MKKIFRLLVLVFALFALTGCEIFNIKITTTSCDHEFREEGLIAVEPTCTEDGYVEGYCTKCNKVAREVYEKYGHEEVRVPQEGAVTCTTGGWTDKVFCSRCNLILEQPKEIEALGHDMVAATCTEASYCKRSGCSYVEGEALGHALIDTVISPTPTVVGYTHHACSRCGINYDDSYVDYSGLSFTKTVIDKTETAHGVTMYECASEGYKYLADLDVQVKALYGYQYFNSLDSKYAKYYSDMFDLCNDFLHSERNLEIYNLQTSDGGSISVYPIGSVDFDKSDMEVINSVFACFILENPWFYFISNKFYFSTSIVSSKIYLCCDDDYNTYIERCVADDYVRLMVNELGVLINYDGSLYNKIETIYDFIKEKVDYAYLSDGTTPSNETWAHNIIGLSKENKGVCECYAKVFYYFCNLYGIKSIMVSGLGQGGPHAWNYVMVPSIMGEEKWYGMDITWDDAASHYTKYFLCSDSTMKEDHVPETEKAEFGLEFLYRLPDLSQIKYINVLG